MVSFVNLRALKSLCCNSAPHLRRSISSLKVEWRKDAALDRAIERDKPYRLFSRVVREVLNNPSPSATSASASACRQKRSQNSSPSTLPFSTSPTPPVLRPSPRLLSLLSLQSQLQSIHEPLAPSPSSPSDDFLSSLVPKNPHLFRLSGTPGKGKSFLELVVDNDDNQPLPLSAIEQKAITESELTGGIPIRPNFTVRKEMHEWERDWLELPYISPYADTSSLHPSSPEMEKRSVAVLHELLSLSLLKRMEVPVIGQFRMDFGLSKFSADTFKRHPGIFYVSFKGGIETAMLREAYSREGELVDRDPMLEVKDKFVEMMEEKEKERKDRIKTKKDEIRKLTRDYKMESENGLKTGHFKTSGTSEILTKLARIF